MEDRLARQLTPSQRKAVFHVEGPLLVIAGPGSGKTRVITCRIAALIDSGVRPQNICAITFTNKAADEMRQRAAALGASAGAHISTFHSLCVKILRRYADSAGIRPAFTIYDQADQRKCVKQAVKDCELDAANFPPARMLDALSALKNKLVDVDAFAARADDFFSGVLARVYLRYQQILTERNALDFDDLLLKTAFLLERSLEVRRDLSDRFRFLLIDEYQDTNHAQYRIARALASEHANICATGDPDQSIYRWRGADIRNILAFETDWPDATIIKLEENFRSTPKILAVADSLIAFNRNRKPKKLIATRPAAGDALVDAFEDEMAEAESVARRAQKLVDEGSSFRDTAVFYRVNAMSRLLEEAFVRNRIPYQIVRGVEFYNRSEIRDLLAYLKVLVNPDDELSLARIINTPARGIGKITTDRVRSFAVRNNITLYAALKKAEAVESLSAKAKARLTGFVKMLDAFKNDIAGPVATLAQRIFQKSGLAQSLTAGAGKDDSALENVNELINAAAQYDLNTQEPSALDYLQQISLFSDADAYDTTGDRVALMTLHAAKGLEFENVFIVGAEEGLLPHEKSNGGQDDDELEEERRLFFVGITRAKTRLQISHARYRTVRGQTLRTIPSQFLFELGSEFSESPEEEDYPDEVDGQPCPLPAFAAGQLVRHKTFGLGCVKQFLDMGRDSIVIVAFNAGQTKSLMVKYAGLSKVQDN